MDDEEAIELRRIKQELERLLQLSAAESAQLEQLRAENEQLRQELAAQANTIRRAKDINPVQRPSLRRVLKLVHDACMNLERVRGGWLLKLGHLTRKFRKLTQIWELLIAEDWFLSEIFPPPAPSVQAQSGDAMPQLPRRYGSIAPAYQPPYPTRAAPEVPF